MTGTWARGIAAITLFVEDLAAAREFYQRAFELPVHFEDDTKEGFLLVEVEGMRLTGRFYDKHGVMDFERVLMKP